MIKKGQLLIYCLLLCSINAYTQPDTDVLFGSRDTVFVYDTLFVMDTIRIFRTAKELESLGKLTPLKISYLDNSSSNKKISPSTATLFHPRINSLNNFNSKNKEMKKLGILGLMFFAFQNMILAQHNVGVHIGGGAYNFSEFYAGVLGKSTDKTLVRPTIQVGLSYRKLIMQEKLYMDIGLAFSKLRPSRTQDEQLLVDNGTIKESGIFTVTETEIISSYEYRTKRNDNLISIPFSLSLNSKFFQPTMGLGIHYRQVYSSITTTRPVSADIFSRPNLHPQFHYLGLTSFVGFRLPITKRFNINVIYVRQFIRDFLLKEDLSVASNPSGKMQRLDITLRYQLLKRKKS